MSSNIIDLIILRHGEAGAAATDFDRSLTVLGRKQVITQYQWLIEQGFKADLILHSPYRRTLETAVLGEHYFPEAKRQVEQLIRPDGEPALVSSLIATFGKSQILMVSHMPLVSNLSTALLSGVDIFGFPVAGLCWIRLSSDDLSASLLHKHWPF